MLFISDNNGFCIPLRNVNNVVDMFYDFSIISLTKFLVDL